MLHFNAVSAGFDLLPWFIHGKKKVASLVSIRYSSKLSVSVNNLCGLWSEEFMFLDR